MIEACKINGIEPFAYLKATLTAIANGHAQSRLDDLLPWNFSPSSERAALPSGRLLLILLLRIFLWVRRRRRGLMPESAE